MDRIAELKLLLLAAETGSFSAAARSANLTPSAVSKIVTRIEERSRIRLFDRTSQSVIPTREGQAYFESLSKVLDAVSELDTLADVLAREPRGDLRVHAAPSFAKLHITPLLIKFAEIYPDVHVEFRLGPRYSGLADDVDIAVQFGPFPDSPFIARKLATSRRVLCAAPAYLEKFGTPKTIDDLTQHRLLNYTMADRTHWRFAVGGRSRSFQVNSFVSSDQAEFLMELTLQGAGIARIAEYVVHEHIAAGRLVMVLEELSVAEGIFALFRNSRNLSPRLRVFINALHQGLKGQPWNLDNKINKP